MLKRVQDLMEGLNWFAGTGRPDLADAASTIPGAHKNMSPGLMRNANLAVCQATQLSVTLSIWPILADKRRTVGFFYGHVSKSTTSKKGVSLVSRFPTERRRGGLRLAVAMEMSLEEVLKVGSFCCTLLTRLVTY